MGKFGKRPMHFFGFWGTMFFLVGTSFSLYLFISKLIDYTYPLTNKPGFYFAIASMVIGIQLFLAGFLGELIARNSASRNTYLIETKAGV
jgi:hypothetical protein